MSSTNSTNSIQLSHGEISESSKLISVLLDDVSLMKEQLKSQRLYQKELIKELNDTREQIKEQGEQIKEQGEQIKEQGEQIKEQNENPLESTDNPEEDLEQQEIGKRIRFVLENDWVKDLLLTRKHIHYPNRIWLMADHPNNFIYKNDKWYLSIPSTPYYRHRETRETSIEFQQFGNLIKYKLFKEDNVEIIHNMNSYLEEISQIYNIYYNVGSPKQPHYFQPGCGQQLLQYKKTMDKFAINYIYKFVLYDKYDRLYNL